MREVYLLPQAQEDLESIQDPLWTEILEKISFLKEYPDWGAPMDGPFTGTRSFVAGIFRVIYTIVSDKRIEILYIRHCKRRLLA